MTPRPFSVTLLAIGVLTLAMVGIVRAWQTILLWDFLTSLDVSPVYMLLTGLIFGLTGFPVMWSLWKGYPKAPHFTIAYVMVILTFFWLDRIFVVQSQISKINIPFAIGVSIFVLLITLGILLRKNGKYYFAH